MDYTLVVNRLVPVVLRAKGIKVKERTCQVEKAAKQAVWFSLALLSSAWLNACEARDAAMFVNALNNELARGQMTPHGWRARPTAPTYGRAGTRTAPPSRYGSGATTSRSAVTGTPTSTGSTVTRATPTASCPRIDCVRLIGTSRGPCGAGGTHLSFVNDCGVPVIISYRSARYGAVGNQDHGALRVLTTTYETGVCSSDGRVCWNAGIADTTPPCGFSPPCP